MFCGKCGQKNANDEKFCTGCGSQLNGTQISIQKSSIEEQQNNHYRKIGIITVSIFAIIIIIVGITLFGGRSYKVTAESFVKSMYNANVETVIDLMPPKAVDYICDDGELDEFIKEETEELLTLAKYRKLLSSKILGFQNITGEDFDNLNLYYEAIGIKISAAKTVEVHITEELHGTEREKSIDVPVVKIGRSWYLDPITIGNPF